MRSYTPEDIKKLGEPMDAEMTADMIGRAYTVHAAIASMIDTKQIYLASVPSELSAMIFEMDRISVLFIQGLTAYKKKLNAEDEIDRFMAERNLKLISEEFKHKPEPAKKEE